MQPDDSKGTSHSTQAAGPGAAAGEALPSTESNSNTPTDSAAIVSTAGSEDCHALTAALLQVLGTGECRALDAFGMRSW